MAIPSVITFNNVIFQMLRIHDWGSQQRVVARDQRGRFVTFPADMSLKVQPLRRSLG